MASNTAILIRRSLSTSKPSTLNQGELAYSYASNTLFIGSPDAAGSLAIAAYNDFSNNYQYGANTYGDQTHIPIITVSANGLITNISTSEISTSLSIDADTGGPSTVDLLSQTLKITGGEGITSNVSGQEITLNVDNTVFRSNTPGANQTVDGDVSISGNLTVLGSQTVVNSQSVTIFDPLILLANNNTHDVLDIGTVGQYSPDGGTTILKTGVYRHAGDKKYYIFDSYSGSITANTINPADPSFNLSQLNVNLQAPYANVSNTLTVESGATLVSQGQTYLNGTTEFDNSATFRHANGLRFNTSDETTFAEIYNDGGAGANWLYVSSEDVEISGNLHVQGTLEVNGSLAADLLPGVYTNIVYYDTVSKQMFYGEPSILANGAYSLTISGTDGLLVTNGAGLQLANGAILKDTTTNAISFGKNAGVISQSDDAVAIGHSAGYSMQGIYSVAVGYSAGSVSQGDYSLAIGDNSGSTNQGTYAVAVGHQAGNSGQGSQAIAIGDHAATVSQGTYGIAIGANAGGNGDPQGTGAIGIGYDAGWGASQYSVAIGHSAGAWDTSALGEYAIAIGYRAGFSSGHNNSIVLNASGADLSASEAGLYINPVRYTDAPDATYDGLMFYNASTKEVRYSYALDGGSF